MATSIWSVLKSFSLVVETDVIAIDTNESIRSSVSCDVFMCMCVYVYVCVFMCVCLCVCGGYTF